MSTDTVGVHMFLGESLPPSLVLLRPIRDVSEDVRIACRVTSTLCSASFPSIVSEDPSSRPEPGRSRLVREVSASRAEVPYRPRVRRS